jgi:hypothetical protein
MAMACCAGKAQDLWIVIPTMEKRSEWVTIVRVSDLVQLLPECLEESPMDFHGNEES